MAKYFLFNNPIELFTRCQKYSIINFHESLFTRKTSMSWTCSFQSTRSDWQSILNSLHWTEAKNVQIMSSLCLLTFRQFSIYVAMLHNFTQDIQTPEFSLAQSWFEGNESNWLIRTELRMIFSGWMMISGYI